jgi:hypothetical protein
LGDEEKMNQEIVKQLLEQLQQNYQAPGHKDLRSVERHITIDANITWIPIKCTTDKEIKQAIKDDCTLVYQADGITYFKKPA